MATVVVPFRSTDPKRRLAAVVEADRVRLAHAMLEDVLEAARPLGDVLVVSAKAPKLPDRARHVPDPRHGQGAAVRAAMRLSRPGCPRRTSSSTPTCRVSRRATC
jgi:2-phospho-L-lactate guanylyltransferase (CobY/MobA/RfbA family)